MEPRTLELRVPGDRVHGGLERFPVRVDLVLPESARAALGSGLRVRDAEGELPQRLSADPATGRVEGWIEIRRLEQGREARLFLDLGTRAAAVEGFSDYALFAGRVTEGPSAQGDFVVEGWLAAEEVRAEAVQVIAAQWAFAPEMTGFATRDAGSTDGLLTRGFFGAVFDGRHVYFAPLGGGAVLRHDPRRPFHQPAAWEVFDPARLPAGSFGQCVGAVFDGRWIYFTPYAHSSVVRYDTRTPFADPASWQVFEADRIGGLRTRGYDGAAFDGRFVYFIPFWEGDDPGRGFHARTLRYDTARPFDDPDSWQAADGGALAPPNPGGFNGGAFDGRFLYMAPWREDEPTGQIRSHGQVLRLDTAGEGARFQLRWMDCGHNGGLGGALPGASFLVNCEDGPVSVRAHHLPGPGWHHVAGVYRCGRGAELWIDGELVGEAPPRGGPVEAAAPITVGHLPGGTGRLAAQLADARIRVGPVPEGWVRTSWESMRDAEGFLRLEA